MREPSRRATQLSLSGSASTLLRSVRQFVADLENLPAAHPEVGEAPRTTVNGAAREIRRRLDRDELWVSIVGEFKAGKSTFLNAVLGAPLLGVGTGEYTGVVTVIRHGDEPDYEYETGEGEVVRFEDEVPDFRPHLRRAVQSADLNVCHSQEALAHARGAVAQTSTRVEQISLALATAGDSERVRTVELEAASRDAAVHRAEVGRLQEEEETHAALVPSFVRRVPPPWAVWWWVLRWVLGWVWARRRSTWVEVLTSLDAASRTLQHADGQVALASANVHQASLERGAWDAELRDARVALAAASDSAVAADRACARAHAALRGAQEALAAHERDRQQKFFRNVQQLAAIGRPGGTVSALTVRYPAPLLADGIVLLDTPGLNTPQKQFEARAWAAIERDADACVLLTPAKQAMSSYTGRVLARMREHIPHVALAVTKIDLAEQDVISDDPADVRAQVDEALADAVRRFAAEMRRSPGDVVWVQTAAERAVSGTPRYAPRWGDAFRSEILRLWRVLAVERVAVLAVRGARLGGAVVHEVRAEVARLEGSYRTRIERLEAERLPDPRLEVETVAKGQLKLLEDAIAIEGAAANAELKAAVETWLQGVESEVRALADQAALDRFVKQSAEARGKALQHTCEHLLGTFALECGRLVQGHVSAAAAEVRERYRIVSSIGIAAAAPPAVPRELGDVSIGGVAQIAAAFDSRLDAGLLAGGAAAGLGAVIGTLLLPGAGTILGGLGGALFGALLGPSLDDLKTTIVEGLGTVASRALQRALSERSDLENRIVQSAQTSMREVLDEEVRRYARWIDSVLVEEQRRIEGARAKLRGLLEDASRIESRGAEMDRLVFKIAAESAIMARAPVVP